METNCWASVTAPLGSDKHLLETEEDNWKELTYDIEEPEPTRHFPRV